MQCCVRCTILQRYFHVPPSHNGPVGAERPMYWTTYLALLNFDFTLRFNEPSTRKLGWSDPQKLSARWEPSVGTNCAEENADIYMTRWVVGIQFLPCLGVTQQRT